MTQYKIQIKKRITRVANVNRSNSPALNIKYQHFPPAGKKEETLVQL